MEDISKGVELNNQSVDNTPVDPTEHVSNSVNSEYDVSNVAPEDLDSRWLRWKCLVCGYLYEGVSMLKVCPKCGNDDPDKFEDAE